MTFGNLFINALAAEIEKMERAALANPNMASHYRGVARKLHKRIAETRKNWGME